MTVEQINDVLKAVAGGFVILTILLLWIAACAGLWDALSSNLALAWRLVAFAAWSAGTAFFVGVLAE